MLAFTLRRYRKQRSCMPRGLRPGLAQWPGASDPTQPAEGLAGVTLDMSVLGGNSDFDELFRREFARLVRALAVSEGNEEAADAVQEAFIQAQRNWSTVSGLDDPAGWVRRVAMNRLANRRRDSQRRREILAALRPPDPVRLEPLDLDLLAAVRALPPQQRRCVALHHVAGLPVDEIADALSISSGTVKSHLHDGRASLRETLERADVS